MAEIIELNQEGTQGERRHRTRHRVKIRKRVKTKKKESPKKLLNKIIKFTLWGIVLLAFIFTIVTVFKTSDVQYKGGKVQGASSGQ
jgi:hypothetical protein